MGDAPPAPPRGVLSLRASALYPGLAAAAVITGLVLAATTRWGADAATTVLLTAALGFAVGKTPPSNDPTASALRRLGLLMVVGVALGAALMAATTGLREVVTLATPCAGPSELALLPVSETAVEGAARGAELGGRLAWIVWGASLPGLLRALARRA